MTTRACPPCFAMDFNIDFQIPGTHFRLIDSGLIRSGQRSSRLLHHKTSLAVEIKHFENFHLVSHGKRCIVHEFPLNMKCLTAAIAERILHNVSRVSVVFNNVGHRNNCIRHLLEHICSKQQLGLIHTFLFHGVFLAYGIHAWRCARVNNNTSVLKPLLLRVLR